MDTQSREYLEQYMELTPVILAKIARHCKRYHIDENICAWYENYSDFQLDWSHCGYTAMEMRRLYHGGIGEFQTFPNGNIIRYVI